MCALVRNDTVGATLAVARNRTLIAGADTPRALIPLRFTVLVVCPYIRLLDISNLPNEGTPPFDGFPLASDEKMCYNV